jgi:quinone-modifying oxidoreductase subunit QmoC
MVKNEQGVSYRPDFAQEVFERVDSAETIKSCMQCGVCAASCPLAHRMEFSPRRIFALIRAGKREEVLSSKDIMLCTSCYSCIVRCPRNVRVMDVMHGLAHYALRQGYLPRKDTAVFGQKFWNSIYKLGRVDEKKIANQYALAEGLIPGIKKGLAMLDIGIAMLLHRRMKLLPEKRIKGVKSLRRMLDKAQSMHKKGESR